MKAIMIKWLTAERNYTNPTANVDYVLVNDEFEFPSTDPNFNPTLPNPNEEILIKTNVVTESAPDQRVYIAVNYSVPTTTKNSQFKFINEFQTSTRYQFKSLPELIEAVKQREREANLKIRLESDFDKLSMVSNLIMAKYGSIPLTENEQKIYDRNLEVQNMAIANDQNARNLIDIATANAVEGAVQLPFAINTGWKEDGITPLNIPFNELLNV